MRNRTTYYVFRKSKAVANNKQSIENLVQQADAALLLGANI